MNDYDERQILARGRAFMWGFFSLIICLMVYGLTDMLIEPWCDTLTGCIICCCVSLIVFAVICIRQDAFAGIGRNPGSGTWTDLAGADRSEPAVRRVACH